MESLRGIHKVNDRLLPALLLVELLVMLALNAWWVGVSDFCLRNDSAMHALACAQYGDSWSDTYSYPKLIPWLLHPLISVMGNNAWPYFLFESLVIVGQAVCLYRCGQKLVSPYLGLLAASLWLGMTQQSVAVRTFFLDYPLAFLILIQYTLYLEAGGAEAVLKEQGRWKSTVCLILFLALTVVGSFIKQQYLLYGGVLGLGITLELLCRRRWRTGLSWSFIFLGACLASAALYFHIYGQENLVVKASDLYLPGISPLQVKGARDWLDNAQFKALTRVNLLLMSRDAWASLKMASLYLQAMLLDLKCRQLGLLLFILTMSGGVGLLARKVTRRRWATPLTFCLLVFPLLTSCTTANTRYYAPLWPFMCLMAAWAVIQLGRVRFLDKLILAWVSLASLILWGGWLKPVSEIYDRVPASFIQCELLYSNMDDFYYVDVRQLEGHTYRMRILKDDSWRDMLNGRSFWSDRLFYTVEPYKCDWLGLIGDIEKALPEGGTITVYGREACQWPLDPVLHACLDPGGYPDFTSGTDVAYTLRFMVHVDRPQSSQAKLYFQPAERNRGDLCLQVMPAGFAWSAEGRHLLLHCQSGELQAVLYKEM